MSECYKKIGKVSLISVIVTKGERMDEAEELGYLLV